MAYDAMLVGVECPANGSRLTRADCDAILRRAGEQPSPGTGRVQWLIPPLGAPVLLAP
jgi:hypothetical protein